MGTVRQSALSIQSSAANEGGLRGVAMEDEYGRDGAWMRLVKLPFANLNIYQRAI